GDGHTHTDAVRRPHPPLRPELRPAHGGPATAAAVAGHLRRGQERQDHLRGIRPGSRLAPELRQGAGGPESRGRVTLVREGPRVAARGPTLLLPPLFPRRFP